MNKIIILLVLILLIVAAVAYNLHSSDRGELTTAAEYTGLVRSVANNELVSDDNPNALLEIAPPFRYLGGQKFVLYGLADTEQYFFVETNEKNDLLSLYWIQFEGYLPDNTYQYDYEDSPARMSLNGYEFYVDTEVVESDPNKQRKKGTDGARARAFLKTKGFEIPQNYVYARLVHLTDASKRNELMVIFIENLSPHGLTGSALREGGPEAQRWQEIERNHLDRISSTLTLTPGYGS